MGGQTCYTNQGNAVGYGHRQRGWRTVRQCSALGNSVLRTWVRGNMDFCPSLALSLSSTCATHTRFAIAPPGVLFFSAAYLSLTRAVSPPYYVSRSFVLCYRKQTARTSEREEYAACRISLSIQCVKIMCGQVLKAVITMCIELIVMND